MRLLVEYIYRLVDMLRQKHFLIEFLSILKWASQTIVMAIGIKIIIITKSKLQEIIFNTGY